MRTTRFQLQSAEFYLRQLRLLAQDQKQATQKLLENAAHAALEIIPDDIPVVTMSVEREKVLYKLETIPTDDTDVPRTTMDEQIMDACKPPVNLLIEGAFYRWLIYLNFTKEHITSDPNVLEPRNLLSKYLSSKYTLKELTDIDRDKLEKVKEALSEEDGRLLELILEQALLDLRVQFLEKQELEYKTELDRALHVFHQIDDNLGIRSHN